MKNNLLGAFGGRGGGFGGPGGGFLGSSESSGKATTFTTKKGVSETIVGCLVRFRRGNRWTCEGQMENN